MVVELKPNTFSLRGKHCISCSWWPYSQMSHPSLFNAPSSNNKLFVYKQTIFFPSSSFPTLNRTNLLIPHPQLQPPPPLKKK